VKLLLGDLGKANRSDCLEPATICETAGIVSIPRTTSEAGDPGMSNFLVGLLGTKDIVELGHARGMMDNFESFEHVDNFRDRASALRCNM
jgi:hypothetical protein